MLVRSIRYPTIERILPSGIRVRFVNGVAEMSDSDALSLAQDPSLYEIIHQQTELANKIPFRPESWRDERQLIWDGHIGYHNGYGKASMAFMESLSNLIDLYPVNSQYNGSTLKHASPKLLSLLKKELPKADTYYVRMQAGQNISNISAERAIGFTMFETNKIPKEWIDNLNKVERVLVPCTQNKEVFEECGVRRDIQVIPLGVTEEYQYMERDSSEEFVFSTMGTLTYRKGTDLLVKAFLKVFPKEQYPNVKLYIKSLGNGGIGHAWFIDPKVLMDEQDRISLYFNEFSPDELLNYFKNIDCFVFPTRGEGFGLPPLEAMATGLPVICTNWSGCADFLNDKVAFPLNYSMVDCPPDHDDWRGFGPILSSPGMQWAEPNFDDLCDKMKFIYDNREKMGPLGKRAAKFVQDRWTYQRAAKKLIDYLDLKF